MPDTMDDPLNTYLSTVRAQFGVDLTDPREADDDRLMEAQDMLKEINAARGDSE